MFFRSTHLFLCPSPLPRCPPPCSPPPPPPAPPHLQSEEARRLTAYHEGGHALVALHTPGAKPIHKATIMPRGHALGMVSQVPDRDEYSTTRQQMMAHIDVCMGGKAAEALIFGA